MHGFLLLILLAAPAASAPGQQAPDRYAQGFDAIQQADEQRILGYLATKCQGRGMGQPGFDIAARFVADEFTRIGLRPIGGGNTYFQHATLEASRARYAFRVGAHAVPVSDSNIAVGYNGYLPQLRPEQLEKSSVTKAPAVFLFTNGAGWPRKLDVQNKIVLWQHTGEDFPPVEAFTQLAKAAKMIVVEDDPPLMHLTALEPGFEGFWAVLPGDKAAKPNHISPFYQLKTPVEALVMRLAGVRRPSKLSRGGSRVITAPRPISFEITASPVMSPTENVVGVLEGSDPVLKNEYVVVSGHLDHFGVRGHDTYAGADDDGSGATAVVEIARGMATNPVRPRRSVVFVTFFGEELGCFGSRFFVAHPPVPLSSIVADLQMDMIGRDSDGPQQQPDPKDVTTDRASENLDTVRVIYGSHRSDALATQISGTASFVGLRLLGDAEYNFGRSDDSSFAAKGIPTAWWFTGYHADYHRPTDTIDKIDWNKLLRVSRHVYLSAEAVADRAGKSNF